MREEHSSLMHVKWGDGGDLPCTIPPCRHVSPAFIGTFEIGGRNAWEDREEVRELREGGAARMNRI